MLQPLDADSNTHSGLSHDVVKGDKEEQRRQNASLYNARDNFKEVSVATVSFPAATRLHIQVLKDVDEDFWHAIYNYDTITIISYTFQYCDEESVLLSAQTQFRNIEHRL